MVTHDSKSDLPLTNFNVETCREDQFQCRSGICKYTDNSYCNGRCIRNSWAKDGEEDCSDGSDEIESKYLDEVDSH